MANEIRYNVEGMRTQASQLEALGERLREAATRMNATIGKLEGNWSGQEYMTFIDEYEQFKGRQENFALMIEAFGQYVKQAAERAESADTQMAQQATKLI